MRHPLERLLSTYLLLFRQTSAHSDMGMTNYITRNWLNRRKNQLKPNPDLEIQVDTQSRPTLTFRQFVNFVTKCPDEVKNCEVKKSKNKTEMAFSH